MEEVAGQIDGLAQLVDVHRRRTAAHIHALEVVTLIGEHPHLLAQGLEVVASALLPVGKAVEGAVGAQPLAEGNGSGSAPSGTGCSVRVLSVMARTTVVSMRSESIDTSWVYSSVRRILALPQGQ